MVNTRVSNLGYQNQLERRRYLASMSSRVPGPTIMKMTNAVQLTPRISVGIKKVIRRIDTDLPDYYYAWADHLALLNEELITQITSCALTRTWNKLYALGWDALPYVYWCHRQVGVDHLWVYPWGSGWSIEVYRTAQQAADVLTIHKMPILCPSPLSAIQVAEACSSAPKHPLSWLPRERNNCFPPDARLQSNEAPAEQPDSAAL